MTKGKENRIRRLVNPHSGKSLIIAVDHGMALGPMKGIVDIRATFQRLNYAADAWLMTKGILEHCFEPDGYTGIIMRVSGGATAAGADLTREGITATVEEALFLGADAVALTAFIGSAYEHETLTNMASVATSCRRWNVPLCGVIGVGKDKEKMANRKFLALGARAAAEHGADIVKTYYTYDGFPEVVAGCPVPVMIAGGPKCDTEEDTLRMIHGAMQDGAEGIVMGRNIWQSPDPPRMIDVVRRIIHEGLSLEDSLELYHKGEA